MRKSRATLVIMVTCAALISPLPASSQDCYSSSIVSPSPFMGNNDEIFKLSDGSVWQVKYEYEYMYEYSPSVVVCPTRNKLIIGSTTLNVQRISGPVARQQPAPRPVPGTGKWELFEEDNLQGSISGTVQQGRIFTTTSGNIYEVTGVTLQLVLELQPAVLVLRKGDTYKLVVDGFDEPLFCKRLNPESAIGGTISSVSPSEVAVIESSIDGEFEGWDGETIFKLSNGQIWQQSSYAYTYAYAYRPNVLIYRSGSVFKMRVDGVDGEIEVSRLN